MEIVILVFGMIVLAFGGLAVNYFVQENKLRAFNTKAETAEAVILEMKRTGGGNDRRLFGMHFVLEVHPSNRPAYKAETEATVGVEDLPQFQPGAVVTVKLDPKNPTNVMIA